MNNGLVIVHYNDFDSLNNLINNVKDYNFFKKIIIVDNNSKEENKSKLRELVNDKIEVIFNEENKGYSYAINIGSKRCIDLDIENITVSNCDVIIKSEDDLIKLVSYLDNDNLVVAPVIEEFNTLNRGWKNPTPIDDILMNMILVNKLFRKRIRCYKDSYYKDDISYVDVVSGCFFMIKATTLKEIDYFDEGVFLYYEENILSKKIEKLNKKICVVNKVHIIHNHSVSIDKNVSRINKLKMQKKSQYYFQKKYNKANVLERFLLKLTVFFTINSLKIIYFFKKN